MQFIIGIWSVQALNLKKLFDVTSFGSKSCLTIEISFESVTSNYKLVAWSLCLCERSFDRHELNVTVYLARPPNYLPNTT